MKTTTLFCWMSLAFFFAAAQAPGSGSAIQFDGINDYVNIPNSPALNSSTITIEAWIKADSYGPNPWSNSIVNKEGWATGNQGYAFRCGQGGRLSFNIGDAGTWYEAVSTPLMSTNQWYHVVGMYDGSAIRIFINGVPVGFTNHSGGISPGSYDVRIGQLSFSAGGGNRLFDGQIDEVRIWNQAISTATLRDWMCRKVDNTHPNFSSLVSYWQLDEGTGTSAQGSLGTSQTGTLVGTPTWVTSGAPIGDASAHLYGGSGPLSLAHPAGDSLVVDSLTGGPQAVHLYRVDQAPNVTSPPMGINQLDTTRYWGVYVFGGSNPTYSLQYNYAGNPLVANACSLDLAKRTNNASPSWSAQNAQDLSAQNQLTLSGASAGEFILGTQNLNLNINASGPLSFCQGDSVALSVAAGSTASIQWQLNGNNIPGATDSSLVVQASGNYTLLLTDQNCSFTPTPLTVQVNATPPVQFGNVAPFCVNGQAVALGTGFPSGGMYSGTGVQAGIFDPSVAGIGIYTLSYVYTDVNGCTDSAQRNIEVLGIPAVSLDPFDGICPEASAIALAGGMPVGGAFSGPGVMNNAFDPAIAGVGQHNLVYTVTDTNGCSNTSTQALEVFPPAAVSLGPDQTICLGSSTTLSSSLSSVYLWNTGDTTRSIMVNPATTTSYSVQVTNLNGCQNSDTITVNIQSAPTANAGADQTICEGTAATLMAAGGASYTWNTGQSGSTVQVQPTVDTAYVVTVFDNVGCQDVDTVRVFVDPLPTADATFSISGGVVSFQNLSLDASSYTWDFGDGSAPDSSFAPSHLYGFNGNYVVTLTATNACGSTTTTLNLNVIASDLEADLGQVSLKLFPNPTREWVQVEVESPGRRAFSIQLFDLQGKILWEDTIEKGRTLYQHPLDLRSLAAGIYFVKAGTSVQRIVKQ